MTEDGHNKFMRRCLELASMADGKTRPNPVVGSVIVVDGKIIGEGYHLRAGMAHAEVSAINSVQDKDSLKRSVLYVNLEPCSHFGKTPPCADLIIASSIKKIVIGTADTSAKVNGAGITKLVNAGCEVITGVLEKESRWLNRRFFTYNEKKRPYIILKWAESADGFIDVIRSPGMATRPTWISGKPERVLVHKWRAEEQSILAGAGTVRADDPHLNVREWKGSDPLKLVLSSSGKLEKNASVFNEGSGTVLFTHNQDTSIGGASNIILNREVPSCVQIAEFLYNQGIQSLFVEGGSRVLEHFIANGLWDEARIFIGREEFRDGIRSPGLSGNKLSEHFFDGSTLRIYSNG